MEIDLTRVDISAKGVAKLFVALLIFLIIFFVAYWLYRKLAGAVTQKAAPATEW